MRRQMSDYQAEVGRSLLALRKSRGMSQEDAMAAAGVSLKTWRNWEHGLRAPYERNWKKLKEGFELTDEQIAAIRGTPPTPFAFADNNGEPSQLDRIEALLHEVLDRLGPDPGGEAETLSDELTGDEDSDVEAA